MTAEDPVQFFAAYSLDNALTASYNVAGWSTSGRSYDLSSACRDGPVGFWESCTVERQNDWLSIDMIRRLVWEPVLPLILLALLVLSGCAHAITIDGRFGDWKDVPRLTVGRWSEPVGDGTADGNDIETVWMTRDADNLFFSVQCAGPIRGSTWSPIFVAMDMDRTASTGYPSVVWAWTILYSLAAI